MRTCQLPLDGWDIFTGHNEFMEQIESWWKDGATREDYEVITGLEEDDFNPQNDGKNSSTPAMPSGIPRVTKKK